MNGLCPPRTRWLIYNRLQIFSKQSQFVSQRVGQLGTPLSTKSSFVNCVVHGLFLQYEAPSRVPLNAWISTNRWSCSFCQHDLRLFHHAPTEKQMEDTLSISKLQSRSSSYFVHAHVKRSVRTLGHQNERRY